MTRWTTTDLHDLTGKRIIVTGATSGLGEITARELAAKGAAVTLAVRNVAKGREAAADMHGEVHVRPLDVSDLDSVRAFADAWDGTADVLINNAGIMQVPYAQSADGFELQLATNYLGPSALTARMLPKLTDRVITLGSQLHRFGRLRLDDINWEGRKYDAFQAYADSKLAGTSFALELDRRLRANGSAVRSIIAHPGIARTQLAAHATGVSGNINRLGPLLNSPERGALSVIYAATQDIEGGAYVGPNGIGGIKGFPPRTGTPSRKAREAKFALDLWNLTGTMTGVATVPAA